MRKRDKGTSVSLSAGMQSLLTVCFWIWKDGGEKENRKRQSGHILSVRIFSLLFFVTGARDRERESETEKVRQRDREGRGGGIK